MNPIKYLPIIVALLATIMTGCESRESKIKASIADNIKSHPQRLFNAFHPVGTAKSVKVHSVQLSGNNANVVFTIFWQGPFTKDGYTKIAAHYDGDIQRWTGAQILATNGTTNRDVGDFAIGFLDGFINGR